MKPLPISVTMISGAEAVRIARALESIVGWCSELIVVLNDDVRDDTEAIALRHGARVFREPWRGFLAQKNSAADKATQPWILNLDADEEVSSELREEILRLFSDESRLERFAGFSCPRLARFCGRWIRHGDWYPDRLTRLWRRGQGRWGGVDPHTHLVVDGPVGRLRHDLLHHTADTIDHHVIKSLRYADDFARHCAATGKSTGFLDLLVRPPWRFVRAYFLRLGFLDGWPGYYLAWHNAFATAARYAKVRESQGVTPKPPV